MDSNSQNQASTSNHIPDRLRSQLEIDDYTRIESELGFISHPQCLSEAITDLLRLYKSIGDIDLNVNKHTRQNSIWDHKFKDTKNNTSQESIRDNKLTKEKVWQALKEMEREQVLPRIVLSLKQHLQNNATQQNKIDRDFVNVVTELVGNMIIVDKGC